MRNIVLVFVLLALTQALTNKEILQQTLNGLFEENKLPDPTTIMPCIDETTAGKIVKFIGEVLQKAAKGSVKDLIALKDLIQKFGDQIPQQVKDCLDGNAQFEKLGTKYGITNTTNSSTIEKKVIEYVTLHYLEVHKWFGDLNSAWKAGKYYQVGFDAASHGHKILGGASQIVLQSDKDTLQQVLNGAFEENHLPDPTTIVPCIDDDTAHKIVVFAGQILDKAAKGSVTDIIAIINMIKDFGDQIPQSVKDCLDGNAEFQALGLKYGITNETNSTDIQKKVITYITFHYIEVHKFLGDINNLWIAGKFYQVGYDTATFAHKILGGKEAPALSDKEILQQGLNGAFEQNKLPDPKTVVDCGDDATAHSIVVFIGDVLKKAAAGSVSDLIRVIQMVKDFINSLPESTKTCMQNNAELKALGLKYGIDEHTDPATIEKKIISYVTFHYLEVHGWMVSLNNQWSSGKYYQAGFDGATDLHKVLGITPQEISHLRQE